MLRDQQTTKKSRKTSSCSYTEKVNKVSISLREITFLEVILALQSNIRGDLNRKFDLIIENRLLVYFRVGEQ